MIDITLPESVVFRGLFVTIGSVLVFYGSVYLLVYTNLGKKLGFLISGAALFGWTTINSLLFVIYAPRAPPDRVPLRASWSELRVDAHCPHDRDGITDRIPVHAVDHRRAVDSRRRVDSRRQEHTVAGVGQGQVKVGPGAVDQVRNIRIVVVVGRVYELPVRMAQVGLNLPGDRVDGRERGIVKIRHGG